MKINILVVLMFLSFNVLMADNPFKVQILGGFAVPLKKYDSGLALIETNENLKFLPGGLFDYGLKVGYKINSKVETDLTLHHQISYLIPDATNVDDKFTKLMLQPEVMFIYNYKQNVKLKYGFGLSYAIKPIFDVDATQIKGGAHNIFYFKNSMGLSLSVQHEIYLRKKKRLSMVTGFSFRYNILKIDHATSNGNLLDVNYLTSNYRNIVQKINASGLDITIGLCYHFQLSGSNRVYEYY